MRRVVVTGIGVVAPNGCGKASFTASLKAGESGLRSMAAMRDAGMECQVAGTPAGFECHATQFLDQTDLAALDRTVALASVAALECWVDAGLSAPAPCSETDWQTGIVCGSGLPGLQTISEVLVPRVNARMVRRLGGTVVQRSMASGAPAAISGLLGLGGPAFVVSSACASGTQAIALGAAAVRNGESDRMLVGGADTDSVYAWAGFDAMRLLARGYNERPEEASRPLSASAQGFVPGAGAAFLMLEALETALTRGARAYAEVAGAAVNAGGQRQGGSMTAANPIGIERCITSALASAGIRGPDVDLINGHFTGTQGDTTEMSAWSRALGLRPDQMPSVQATKGLIGHTLGAAGAIEGAAVCLQIAEGFAHPNRNCEDLHPQLAAYARAIRETTVRPVCVAKASFGFGDVNACLVFRAFA